MEISQSVSHYVIPVLSILTRLQNLDLPQIEAIVAEIEREKEAGELSDTQRMPVILIVLVALTEAERKRSRLAATAAGQAAMTQAAGTSGQ